MRLHLTTTRARVYKVGSTAAAQLLLFAGHTALPQPGSERQLSAPTQVHLLDPNY